MRKVTVKVKLNVLEKFGILSFFKQFDKFEFEEMLKLDLEKGIKVIIVTITLKKGIEYDKLKIPKHVEFIDILSQKDNTYTVVMKSVAPKAMMKIAKSFGFSKLIDMDLIYAKPTYFLNNEMTYTCIGRNEELQKFVKFLKIVGTIKSINYNIADYKGHNLLGFLTDKQKDIFRIAKSKGYYEYPRKINGTELAKELGVTKATLIEHLRKIENKVFSNIAV